MPNDLKNFILEEAYRITLGKHITKDTVLMEVMDSLDYAELMLACERKTGKTVSESQVQWRNIKTVTDLAELFS